MPFKNIERFRLSNVAEDTGRNNELRRRRSTQISQGIDESKCIDSFEYRDYQKESIEALIFNGYGRGLIEIPTSGGKSFIIANFIWNVWKNIDRNYKTKTETLRTSVPILRDTGLSTIINAIDIFTAIEEHFSLLKTESERTEPIGSTNDDKIIMHGFDTKSSFRG